MELPSFDYTLYEENCGHEWRNWFRSFEWYLKANHIDNDDDKFAKLMHLAGRKVQEVYETLPTPVAVTQVRRGPLATGFVSHLTEYELAIAKLNDFFEPKKNVTYERHMFRLVKQEKGEKISIFAMRLRTQADKCDFGNTAEDNIKDQIIEKCVSAKLRRELLKLGDNSNLEQVLKTAKIFEAIEETSKTFDSGATSAAMSEEKVNRIESKPAFKGNSTYRDKQNECTRCGFTGHRSFDEKCPAKGKTCNKCNGRDHFSRKCRTKKRFRSGGNQLLVGNENKVEVKREESEQSHKKIKSEESSTVKLVDTCDSNIKDEYIFSIDDEQCDGSGMTKVNHASDNLTKTCDAMEVLGIAVKITNEICLKIGGVTVQVVLDSGSKYNIVDSKTWEMLKANKVIVSNQRKESVHTFKSYGGHPLTTIGIFEATIETKFKSCVADFIVSTLR